MLNVHSYFSFKYGLFSVPQLLEWAHSCLYKTLALTDINNTAGHLEFVRQSVKHGIRPLLGVDFRNGAVQQYVVLAKDNEGYYELNQYLSGYLHSQAPFPAEIQRIAGCFVLYPFLKVPKRPLEAWEYVMIKPYEIGKARFAKSTPSSKLIACPTFTMPQVWDKNEESRRFLQQREFELHQVLRAIDSNTLVTKLRGEEMGDCRDIFLTKRQLLHAYRDLPESLQNLQDVVSQCRVDFQFGEKATPQNLKYWTGSPKGDYEKVRELCGQGLAYRYGANIGEQVTERLERELKAICDQGFLSYFLISWDIVDYARRKGYYYVGRGSGANSIVAYLLRITDVDPIDLKLYFERFINLFRKNPPDFDIDFSSKDRDDITRYIFDRYQHVALLATHNTFQHRAVVREVGKALGVPPYEIDRLQATVDKEPDYHSKKILEYGRRLTGFPSHLSVHAGGILIADQPIHRFTSTSLPPKGFPITHFDMLISEDVGLYKFDILAQRGLGKIKDTLAIIKENQPNRLDIDIHNVKLFFEDPLVKINLREAKAIGCFYVESPAMRMLLTKLRAEDYETLVAASSIIRPGVAKSGMMREYVLRHRMPSKRAGAHPILKEIMPDTYGVMVYQEDVIKVAHEFAGLSPGESDVLRRGMSGKFRSREEFQGVKEKFFRNCQERGHASMLIHDVWRQIESFAGYAFAKGHSASYAVESYQSLFLKSHYPLEFMVAVINNGGGFYSREFYVHEARMHGANVELPCVNTCEAYTIIRKKVIFLGLDMIKDLEGQVIVDILVAREREGSFQSLDEFVGRVSISLEQLSLLIRIDAFRFTGVDKKSLLWRAYFLLGNTGKSQTVPSLFRPVVKRYALPEIEHVDIEDTYDQMELLGFPLAPPFQLLKNRPGGCVLVREFKGKVNQKVRALGYLITTKRTRTSKSDEMYFGNFLDEEGKFIDTVHFPPIAKKYPFNGRGIYVLEGKVVEEFDAISIEVTAMQRLEYKTIEV